MICVVRLKAFQCSVAMISRTDGFSIPFQFKGGPLVALLSPSVHACPELSPQVTLPVMHGAQSQNKQKHVNATKNCFSTSLHVSNPPCVQVALPVKCTDTLTDCFPTSLYV